MDNLTHTLTGVLLARAGLRRLTPRATWISVVAANIPDIDILVGPSGINYLNYHRHLTHSLFSNPSLSSAYPQHDLPEVLASLHDRVGLGRARERQNPVHDRSDATLFERLSEARHEARHDPGFL